MELTIPAQCQDGIWYPHTSSTDTRAQTVWSTAAQANPIRAAAATGDENPFAKYPDWIRPHFATKTGLLLDAGCGYGRVSIPLLKSVVRANGPVRAYTRAEARRLFRGFSRVSVEAHQMIVLPRNIASVALPFAALSRRANQYFTEHWMHTFRHASLLVNHYDVVAVK